MQEQSFNFCGILMHVDITQKQTTPVYYQIKICATADVTENDYNPFHHFCCWWKARQKLAYRNKSSFKGQLVGLVLYKPCTRLNLIQPSQVVGGINSNRTFPSITMALLKVALLNVACTLHYIEDEHTCIQYIPMLALTNVISNLPISAPGQQRPSKSS